LEASIAVVAGRPSALSGLARRGKKPCLTCPGQRRVAVTPVPEPENRQAARKWHIGTIARRLRVHSEQLSRIPEVAEHVVYPDSVETRKSLLRISSAPILVVA
jgi:hypothetical protein